MGLILKEMNLENTAAEYTGKSWRGDIGVLSANVDKIKKELGFSPKVGLEEGISKTIKYLREDMSEKTK